MNQPTHVDLAFSVHGSSLPSDHGYALYGALCRLIPSLHGASWVGIQAIPGRARPQETIGTEAGSHLRLRIPSDRITTFLGLTGATLDINGHAIRLGPPVVHRLRPAAALDARLVAIRLTDGLGRPFDSHAFDERFAAEANRQLEALGVRGELILRGRRRIQIRGQRIVGHAVGVTGLSAADSLRLQIEGIGGKRAMGCGIFRRAIAVSRASRAPGSD